MATLSAASTPYPEIPDKLYFRIGEVARLAGVKPYVLRYWETEFSGLGPKKSGSNHRLYRRKDVEMVLDIKHLLYEKRYTIEGARKQMMDWRAEAQTSEPRVLAKPAQAAMPVAASMAVAVGAGANGSGNGPLAASAVAAAAAAAKGGSRSRGIVNPVVAPAVAPLAPAVAPLAPASLEAFPMEASERVPEERPAAPRPAISGAAIGAIRAELRSLLDLLSH